MKITAKSYFQACRYVTLGAGFQKNKSNFLYFLDCDGCDLQQGNSQFVFYVVVLVTGNGESMGLNKRTTCESVQRVLLFKLNL